MNRSPVRTPDSPIWNGKTFAEDDNFDAPEGIDLMTNTHSRPDGGEARV